MGGREPTQAFVRLFLLPGVEHGTGGPGADTIDYLTSLERWVEAKTAPERLVAYHLKPKERAWPPAFPIPEDEIEFSRPVYPYPIRVRYLGHGDSKLATSFGPIRP